MLWGFALADNRSSSSLSLFIWVFLPRLEPNLHLGGGRYFVRVKAISCVVRGNPFREESHKARGRLPTWSQNNHTHRFSQATGGVKKLIPVFRVKPLGCCNLSEVGRTPPPMAGMRVDPYPRIGSGFPTKAQAGPFGLWTGRF